MKSLTLTALLLLSFGSIRATGSPVSGTGTISVVVQGAVRKPQKLTIAKGTMVSQAVALCAGLTDTAKARDTSITPVPTGSAPAKPTKVDLIAVGQKLVPDVVLKDGDIVKVPDSAAPAAPKTK